MVRVMDLREILAEKLRAASGRARYRDFYDIAMILDAQQMDMGEILNLVRQKEIRETISQESILRNWGIAKQEKGKGVDLIAYTKEISEEKILESILRIGPFEVRNTWAMP
jgi:predicted nucleotidyltransferase component of viral defense system